MLNLINTILLFNLITSIALFVVVVFIACVILYKTRREQISEARLPTAGNDLVIYAEDYANLIRTIEEVKSPWQIGMLETTIRRFNNRYRNNSHINSEMLNRDLNEMQRLLGLQQMFIQQQPTILAN